MTEEVYTQMIQDLSRELANETLARIEFHARLKTVTKELEEVKKELDTLKKELEKEKGEKPHGVE